MTYNPEKPLILTFGPRHGPEFSWDMGVPILLEDGLPVFVGHKDPVVGPLPYMSIHVHEHGLL